MRKIADLYFGGECEQIIFMCKYCDPNRGNFQYTNQWLEVGNQYVEYPFKCSSAFDEIADNRKMLESIYNKVTQDGQNFTYFKFNSQVVEISFSSFEYKLIERAKYARNIGEILVIFRESPDHQANLDDIMLSILLEKMPKPPSSNKYIWKYSELSPALGAVGTEANLNTIKMSSNYYNFLTCDKRQLINPGVYIKPFKSQVWIVLGSAIVLTVAMNAISIKTDGRYFPFHIEYEKCSISLTILSLLLNTFGYGMNIYKNKTLRTKILLGVWLLTSIILSNAYRGDTFAKTVAPLETANVETFEELLSFTVYTESICSINQGQDIVHCFTFNFNLFTWLSRHLPSDTELSTVVSLFNLGPGGSATFERVLGVKLLKMERTMIELIMRTNLVDHEKYKTELNVENLLGKCHKTAYIAVNRDVQRLVKNLNKNCSEKIMYSGKDKWFEETSEWYVEENGGSRIFNVVNAASLFLNVEVVQKQNMEHYRSFNLNYSSTSSQMLLSRNRNLAFRNQFWFNTSKFYNLISVEQAEEDTLLKLVMLISLVAIVVYGLR
ncbi:unnamed protein product [Orchesella dallaii]|uniref:Ionotropic glutamate receptor C-terminal domain-containing protein n=1 Tax=Orchesella dallaii TaxID=48710 RepID=A0ABP1S7Q3_9HEXA